VPVLALRQHRRRAPPHPVRADGPHACSILQYMYWCRMVWGQTLLDQPWTAGVGLHAFPDHLCLGFGLWWVLLRASSWCSTYGTVHPARYGWLSGAGMGGTLLLWQAMQTPYSSFTIGQLGHLCLVIQEFTGMALFCAELLL